MDNLEGFFLGRFWTDSNYFNKKHFGLQVAIGILGAIPLALAILWPAKASLLFPLPSPVNLGLFLFLYIFLPALAALYWHFPLPARAGVLAGYTVQYYLLLAWFSQWVSQKVTVRLDSLPSAFAEDINKNMNYAAQIFKIEDALLSTFVTFISAIAMLGLTIVGYLLLAIVVPPLLFNVAKGGQRVIDYIWYRFVFRRHDYSLSAATTQAMDALPSSLARMGPARQMKRQIKKRARKSAARSMLARDYPEEEDLMGDRHPLAERQQAASRAPYRPGFPSFAPSEQGFSGGQRTSGTRQLPHGFQDDDPRPVRRRGSAR